MGFAPFLKIFQAALIEPFPFCMKLQRLGPCLLLHYLMHAFVESSLVVLERQIKCIALYWLLITENETVGCDRYTDVQCKPRFADLRLARKQRDAFGNDFRQNDTHGLELFCLQLLCRNQPVPPCCVALAYGLILFRHFALWLPFPIQQVGMRLFGPSLDSALDSAAHSALAVIGNQSASYRSTMKPPLDCSGTNPAASDQRSHAERGSVELGIPTAALACRNLICRVGERLLGIDAFALAGIAR